MDKKTEKKAKQYLNTLEEWLQLKIISLNEYYKIKTKIIENFVENNAKTVDK